MDHFWGIKLDRALCSASLVGLADDIWAYMLEFVTWETSFT
jgi:hypothetical protein